MFLRQSTPNQSGIFGPFVDDVSGVLPQTALSITTSDILVSKNGRALAAINSGSGVHDQGGWYTVVLDATDTDTVGNLKLTCKMSGALHVWEDYVVLEEKVYDGLMATDGDYLSPTAIGNLEDMYDGTGYTAGTGPVQQSQLTTVSGVINDRLPSSLVNGRIDANLGSINGNTEAAELLQTSASTMASGVVETSDFTATTSQWESSTITEATADHFIGRITIFTTGSLAKQASVITDYELGTAGGKFTVGAMTEAPASGDRFIIV